MSMLKIQSHLWDREDFTKKYTSIYNNMSNHKDYRLRITVWPGKDYCLTS